MIDKLTVDAAIVELEKLVNEPDVDVTGIQIIVHRGPDSYSVRSYGCDYKTPESQVAEWMMKHGYATGHGDTVVDLLTELEWQVAEKEREACAKLCESMSTQIHGYDKHGYVCTTPPAAPVQEPMAWQGVHDKTDLYYRKPPQADVRPLYTTPPAAQHQWVGLTDEEIDVAVKSCNTVNTYKYFRAIEAKLKEKNT